MATEEKMIMTTNPLRDCGLTPQLLQKIFDNGGAKAIRQIVRAQKHSLSRVFHPDVTGKQTAFYTKFLDSMELVERMSDSELTESIVKLKQPKPSSSPTKAFSPGKIIRSLSSTCRNGHLPSAREVSFYPLMAPGTKYVSRNARNSGQLRPPLSIIRPTKTGVEYRRIDSDEWIREEGLFFAGSFDRKIDVLLRSVLPWEYHNSSVFLLPGRVSGGRETLKAMVIADTILNAVEEFYTPEVISLNALALVDAAGNLLHAGYIYEKI